MSERLYIGNILKNNDKLTSVNNNYTLSFDLNGNLSLKQILKNNNGSPITEQYRDNNGLLQSVLKKKIIWKIETETNKPISQNNVLAFEKDGNLSVLNYLGERTWETKTRCMNAKVLIVHDDGNLIMYDNAGNPIWDRKGKFFNKNNVSPNCKVIENFSQNYKTDKNGNYSQKDIYLMGKDLLSELNILNADYAKYVRCKYNDTYKDTPDYESKKLKDINGNDLICSDDEITGKILNKRYTDFMNDLNFFNNLIATKIPINNPPLDDPITIENKHSEIVKFRKEMDVKLAELNEIHNSMAKENRLYHDTTVYMSLIWATMATSIVYFIFVRL